MNVLARALRPRVHYAWVIVALVFALLLCTAGVRSAPGVFLLPLEKAFGWDRATVSSAIALNLVLFGMMGPFGGGVMLRFGIRRTVLVALVLLACGVGLSTQMTQPWHLMLTWGLMVGIGCGMTANVLAATIVNRWFAKHRGLAIGFLSSSTAMGQLLFLPLLAAMASTYGWQAISWTLVALMVVVFPLLAWLLVERPEDIGVHAYGATSAEPVAATTASGNPIAIAGRALARAIPSGDFWLLFGTFFICGLSTSGLVATHFIAFCSDVGVPEFRAAGMLAIMGTCNLFGAMLSGWLSDRCDSRWLLFWIYGLRGISLLYLPYADATLWGLGLFAIFYGLDWIATLPPTLRIINDKFGRRDAGILYGWIFLGHQLGAGSAALGGGTIRYIFGAYTNAFLIAGAMCAVAALCALAIGRGGRPMAAAAA